MLIVEGVFIELKRRKDVYVFAMLIAVFCVGALAVRRAGVTTDATGAFVLNLGLTLAYVFAQILTLTLAARQIPTDIEQRTIYPVLARPISRGDYLIGKWVACCLCGTVTYGIFFSCIWAASHSLSANEATLVPQLVILVALSLCLTAAMALCLSLLMAQALVVVLVGGWIFLGHSFVRTVSAMTDAGGMQRALDWVLAYLPQFSKLNLTTRYTDGIEALAPSLFGGLTVYALFYTALVLWGGRLLLMRRTL